jgi:hypothetical protein
MRRKSGTFRENENGLTRLIEIVDVQSRRFSSPSFSANRWSVRFTITALENSTIRHEPSSFGGHARTLNLV